MKKIFIILASIVLSAYIIICVLMYANQEKLIFHPEKLDSNYKFSYTQPFEELNISTPDGQHLNGLLFKADTAKGLVFYLHGNAGSLSTWGDISKTYTGLGYDIFMPDYPGFGKSEGPITSQQQVYDDLQSAYNEMKKRYSENKIVVLGYSIGSGLAAKLASVNNPRLLILQAPYYSLTDMLYHTYPFVPSFLLKYKFATNDYVKDCHMPIVMFHGDKDEIIYYESSVKLRELMKPTDTLITLAGQKHNRITDNLQYQKDLQKILAN